MNRFTIPKYLLSIMVFCFGIAQITNSQDKVSYREWWHEQYPKEINPEWIKTELPRISVTGNQFTDENGKTVFFRGMSIADPDKVEKNGQWGKDYFVQVKKWNVNLVRIPVHPVAWRDRGIEGYLSLLDDAVKWCSELGMYIIVDWHSIGNLEQGLYQDPMYETSKPETYNFWRIVAKRYKDANAVAFYEIFNEPTLFRGNLGNCSWADWRIINEEVIDIIYSFDKNVIPLVAGFDWAYDLNPLKTDPVKREGIAYVTHPYPHKRKPPYADKWEENFGFAADKYPIIATEIGFTMGNMGLEENGEYGKEILKYLENRGISWVIWVFDPEWHPQLIQDWSYKPTEYGNFFLKHLTKK
jgi:endoglucanase